MEPKEILKKARKVKGYTQETFAAEIGVTPRAYQRYENGEFPKFKNDTIKEIDKILGTNLCEILYDNNSRVGEDKIDIEAELNGLLSNNQEELMLIKAAIEILREKYAEIKYDSTGIPISKTLTDLDEEIKARYRMRFDELKEKL